MIVNKFVNSVFNSNTYILSIEKAQNCWLIDCGDAEVLIDWIQEHNKNLVGIFITHSHFDHIYGLNKVIETFPDCSIYTSQKGKEGLFSDKLNFSKYNGDRFIYQYDNISILEDYDFVELFPNVLMYAITTPGHDWSCLTYNSGNYLFTGDSFLPDYKIITKFPKSDKIQAKESLFKIKTMIKLGARNVYPGHGNIKKLFRCE